MKKTGFSILLTLAAITAVARPAHPNVLDIKECITDSTIIYPESFETDTRKLMESWYMRNYTATDDRYLTAPDPQVSDEEIIRRLKAMPTVIEMPFNQIVKSYIKRYTSKARPQVAAILGLSHYYEPIFEQALEAQGMPLELKYLPVIESALDPNAVSRQGATGLWQIMLGTARGLGLEVSSLVDERRDPYMASEKAVAYLKDLYAAYGDWTLAIAAYNCGPGNVNKALRRAGGDPDKHDFWSIYNYLPAETRGYVPMFIAANYVMNYYRDHNISPVLATKPLVTDTVAVTSRIHFNQISEILDIPVDELRILNPQFRADIIPASADRQYYLILPSQQAYAYVLSENQIRERDAEKYAQRGVVEPGDLILDDELIELARTTDAPANVEDQAVDESENDVALVKRQLTRSGTKTAISHKVAAGESLASIAEKYNVDPKDIRKWNGLRRNAVRVGQQLRIMTASDVAENEAQSASPVNRVPYQDNSIKGAAANKSLSVSDRSSGKRDVNSSKETQRNKREQARNDRKGKKAKSTVHTVKSGESLSRIATKYGVTVNELKRANGISGNTLQPGDKIKVPSKGSVKEKSRSKKSKSTAGTGKKKKKSSGKSTSKKKKSKKRR